MKATELRIGNWVEIISTEDSEYVQCNANTIKLAERGDDLVYPIPLTEEWLLKFGFKKQGYLKFLGDAYDRFVLGRNSLYSLDRICFIYEVNEHDLVELKYVHQLQNLYFALTGEELKIKE